MCQRYVRWRNNIGQSRLIFLTTVAILMVALPLDIHSMHFFVRHLNRPTYK